MHVKRVLVIYKKSAYQIYVLERKNRLFVGRGRKALGWDIQRLQQAHTAHQRTLQMVVRTLTASGLAYRVIYRAMAHDYTPYDLVISVGGDGTVLEAARGITRQLLLGINSDPGRSAGSFCRADARSFKRLLEAVLDGGARTQRLQRLQLILNGEALRFSVLNDILVAHENPAAMSRYWISIDARQEEQRDSGLWISTAAGSTAAMRSPGGRILPRGSMAIQYLTRELYRPSGVAYHLSGGVIPGHRTIAPRSLVRQGMVYLDGAHRLLPFRYVHRLRVVASPIPLRIVEGLST